MKLIPLTSITIQKRFLCYLLFCILTAGAGVASAEVLTQIVPTTLDGGPASVHFYKSKEGALSLTYQQEYPDHPSEIYSMGKNNGRWSSPVLIPGLDQNEQTLHGVINLANSGLPLLLMSGDNTDYAQVFNLTAPPAEPANPGDPILPGIPNDQLQQFLADNQRLFYRLQINGAWSQAVPLPGSLRAGKPVLTAGDDGSALIVFSRDSDKNPATTGDVQLFATVYKNSVWSNPLQLTANNTAKYGVQVQYVQGSYLLAWVEDQDGDLVNRADSQLIFATISSDGTVSSPSTIISSDQNDPTPILGRVGNKAVLLWMSQANAPDDPQRVIWESQYDGVWSNPQQSGLLGLRMSSAKIYPMDAGPLFVYRDSGSLHFASLLSGVWTRTNSLVESAMKTGLTITELEHELDNFGHLHFAAVGHIQAAGETAQSINAGDGLFYGSRSVSFDLRARVLATRPYEKYLGKAVELDYRIENNGSLPSVPFTIEIRDGAQLLQTINGQSIAPGDGTNFTYKFTTQKIETPLEITVIANGDAKQDNNSTKYPVKILPDYVVRSVIRKDATHFEADIVDIKGMAAPPVKVEVYLNDAGQQNLVASGMFDPNDGLPMTITTNETVDKITPYQLVFKVNSDRKIPEDKFNNNQGAYNNVVLPDFIIRQLYITQDQVHVTVSNRGSQTVGEVDLLLTDDPLLLSGGQQGAVPWLYQSVNLDNSGDASLVLNRADYPALSGDNLYAVVNPYGKQEEVNRNNNQQRTLVKSSLAMGEVGGGIDGPTVSAKLVFQDLHSWCNNIQATIENTGNIYAISPTVKVVNAYGFAISTRSLATIPAGGSEVVAFQDLPAGDYTVYLSHTSLQGEKTSITGNVSILDSPECQGITQSDVALNEVAVKQVAADQSEVDIQFTFSTRGRLANYRKPLIRVSLFVDVKQGTQEYYQKKYIVYLPANTTTVFTTELKLPRSAFPAGISTLTARIVERDDEQSTTNNQFTLIVDDALLATP